MTRLLNALDAAPSAFLAVVLLVVPACLSRDKREAERVLAAIERLRDSDANSRETHLTALESMHSEVAPAEKARAVCATTFRALLNAQKLVKQASRKEDDWKANLEAAQRELEISRRNNDDCNKSRDELRRWMKKN